jgi:hypothetical protein
MEVPPLNIILDIFQKFSKKIQISLKYDKNNNTVSEDLGNIMIVSHFVLLGWRNVSDKRWREKQNTFCVR